MMCHGCPPSVHMQEFHYHLRGSDTCLPCDCYPVGSFSRSCDPETGQCQCRPGVIGRQCNACDNPFAEVTNSGCEGEGPFFFKFHHLFFRHFGELRISLLHPAGRWGVWSVLRVLSITSQKMQIRPNKKGTFSLLQSVLSKITVIPPMGTNELFC